MGLAIDWSLATSKLGDSCHSSTLAFSPIGGGSHTNVVYSVWGQSFQSMDVPWYVVLYNNTTFYVYTGWLVVYLYGGQVRDGRRKLRFSGCIHG